MWSIEQIKTLKDETKANCKHVPRTVLYKHTQTQCSCKLVNQPLKLTLPVDQLVKQQALVEVLKTALPGAAAPLQLNMAVQASIVPICAVIYTQGSAAYKHLTKPQSFLHHTQNNTQDWFYSEHEYISDSLKQQAGHKGRAKARQIIMTPRLKSYRGHFAKHRWITWNIF